MILAGNLIKTPIYCVTLIAAFRKENEPVFAIVRRHTKRVTAFGCRLSAYGTSFIVHKHDYPRELGSSGSGANRFTVCFTAGSNILIVPSPESIITLAPIRRWKAGHLSRAQLNAFYN